jgi:hypothetical protein
MRGQKTFFSHSANQHEVSSVVAQKFMRGQKTYSFHIADQHEESSVVTRIS